MINDKGKVESSSYRCRKWKEEKEKRGGGGGKLRKRWRHRRRVILTTGKGEDRGGMGWGEKMNELNKCKTDRVLCEDNKECWATNENGKGELLKWGDKVRGGRATTDEDTYKQREIGEKSRFKNEGILRGVAGFSEETRKGSRPRMAGRRQGSKEGRRGEKWKEEGKGKKRAKHDKSRLKDLRHERRKQQGRI